MVFYKKKNEALKINKIFTQDQNDQLKGKRLKEAKSS